METIRSKDGTAIAYQRSGTGSPLILVHGAVADHTRWLPVLPPLEQHFAIYAVDRRGRGGSGDANGYALAREFEDVAAVIDSIGGPVNVLGHSLGAFCCLEAACLTPNVRKLILYEPPSPGVKGTMSADAAARMQSLLDAGDRDGVISTFLREVAGLTSHELELMRSAPSWQGRVATAHTILREIKSLESHPPFDTRRLTDLRMPTLLLLGGDSLAAYRDSIHAIHALLPNSRIVVMPGQQHVAMNTAPELFLREVLDFLNEPD